MFMVTSNLASFSIIEILLTSEQLSEDSSQGLGEGDDGDDDDDNGDDNGIGGEGDVL
jgi:hypothetical protein